MRDSTCLAAGLSKLCLEKGFSDLEFENDFLMTVHSLLGRMFLCTTSMLFFPATLALSIGELQGFHLVLQSGCRELLSPNDPSVIPLLEMALW